MNAPSPSKGATEDLESVLLGLPEVHRLWLARILKEALSLPPELAKELVHTRVDEAIRAGHPSAVPAVVAAARVGLRI